MQVYIESLIWFGSTKSKLLMVLYRYRSICGWTILSLNLVRECLFITTHISAMMMKQAGIVFSVVCACACLSVCTKAEKTTEVLEIDSDRTVWPQMDWDRDWVTWWCKAMVISGFDFQ